MGVDPASGAEEEDVAHEEAAQADGGQGIEGRDGAEQVLELWEGEEDASVVSVLCAVYVRVVREVCMRLPGLIVL